MKKWMSGILCFLAWSLLAQNKVLFDSATADYNQGNYNAAVEKYQKILESGMHSAELYYNLGNSYYKLNQIAPSIYYYEKGLLLAPNDPEIKNNLAFARNMTLDDIEPLPKTTLSRITAQLTGLMTFDQWAYLAVGCMILFVLLYIAYYFLRYASHKRLAFVLSMVCLVFSLATVMISYIQYERYEADQPAIIFAGEAAVKSEPNTRSQDAFKLHEGTKVEVLETLNDWKKIELADGSTGWIPQKDLKMLKDF